MVTFGFVHATAATAASQEATDKYFGVGEHMLHWFAALCSHRYKSEVLAGRLKNGCKESQGVSLVYSQIIKS